MIDLTQLLDRHPPCRNVLRALAVVEEELAIRGALVFEGIPAVVLGKALAQLERLVVDWSPRGLADLRSRLAVALVERAAVAAEHRDAPVLSDFWGESRLSVADASLSVFDEALRKWAYDERSTTNSPGKSP